MQIVKYSSYGCEHLHLKKINEINSTNFYTILFIYFCCCWCQFSIVRATLMNVNIWESGKKLGIKRFVNYTGDIDYKKHVWVCATKQSVNMHYLNHQKYQKVRERDRERTEKMFFIWMRLCMCSSISTIVDARLNWKVAIYHELISSNVPFNCQNSDGSRMKYRFVSVGINGIRAIHFVFGNCYSNRN